MRLKPPTFEIHADDPFLNDLLGRKRSADILTELVRSSDDGLVLCLNAPWGEGKTTFLRMWRQQLKNAGVPTVYFNAWENDFSENGLISLIGELDAGLQELSIQESTVALASAHLTKAKTLGVALLKRTIPTAIKLATAGALDLDRLTEETLSKLGEKLAEEQIKRYEDSKKSIEGFRAELSKFAEQVTAAADTTPRPPIVILVDELDRCRPPYAIEILEKIKHFFSVPHVVFMLAVDKVQLGHSIRSMYGIGMNVDGYLRRFIDVDFSLPSPEKGAFCRAQFARYGLRQFFDNRQGTEMQYDYGQFEQMFTELFSALDFSLREQEHCFTLLSMAIRTTPENYLLYPLLLGTLIVLKIKNPQLYGDFVSGRRNSQAVLDYLGSTPGGRDLLSQNYGIILEAHLLTCRPGSFNEQELSQRYQTRTNDASLAESERERAKRMVQILQSMSFQNTYGVLDYLAGKIDLVSKFQR